MVERELGGLKSVHEGQTCLPPHRADGKSVCVHSLHFLLDTEYMGTGVCVYLCMVDKRQ